MSKTKKNRKNKKYDPKTKMREITNERLAKIYFLAGDCIDNVILGGTTSIHSPKLIRQNPHQWTCVMFLFCSHLDKDDDDPEKFFYIDKTFTEEERCRSSVVSKRIGKEINQFARECDDDETYKNDKTISMGFIAIPSLETNVDEIIDEVVQIFNDNGCFDEIACGLVYEMNRSAIKRNGEKEDVG